MYDVIDKKNKKKRGPKTEDWGDFGNLIAFDQRPFVENYDEAYNGLLEYGYVYYPTSCIKTKENKAKPCKVHFWFHGCTQTSELIGDLVVRELGWLQWAANNDMIVVMPQVKWGDNNVDACWSTEEYIISDPNAWNKDGV